MHVCLKFSLGKLIVFVLIFHVETPQAIKHSPYPTWFILLICLLTTCMLILMLASVIGWCLYKRKKVYLMRFMMFSDHSYSPDQQNEFTVYEKVDSATLTENSKPNAPATIYCTIQKQPISDAEDKSVHPKPE
ncbi:hypothetical protein PO909_031479 [Leuciscus waleckii]